MRIDRAIVCAVAAFGFSNVLGAATAAAAGGYAFTPIRVPATRYGFAQGVNNADQVVGITKRGGFVWTKGVVTIVKNGAATDLSAINDKGLAVGEAIAAQNQRIMFLYDTTSNIITPLPAPASTNQFPNAINLSGEVTGTTTPSGHSSADGFKASSQKFHVFSAAHHPGSATEGKAIDNTGRIVGSVNNSGIFHGFIYKSGVLTILDAPNSTGTIASSLSGQGIIGGYFNGTDKVNHGFTFDGSTYTVVDYPGSVATYVIGVDHAGAVFGNWQDTAGNDHGFVERAGVFYSIDFPNALSTDITAVNGKNTIVGDFAVVRSGLSTAFIARCTAGQPECAH